MGLIPMSDGLSLIVRIDSDDLKGVLTREGTVSNESTKVGAIEQMDALLDGKQVDPDDERWVKM